MVSTSWFLHALSRGSQYQAPTHRRDRTSQMLWAIPCVAPSRAHGCALDVCAEDGVHQRHRHLHVDVAALPHEQRVRPHLQGSAAQLSARSAGSGHSMQKLHTQRPQQCCGTSKGGDCHCKAVPGREFRRSVDCLRFFFGLPSGRLSPSGHCAEARLDVEQDVAGLPGPAVGRPLAGQPHGHPGVDACMGASE